MPRSPQPPRPSDRTSRSLRISLASSFRDIAKRWARNPYARWWLWIPGSCYARPVMTVRLFGTLSGPSKCHFATPKSLATVRRPFEGSKQQSGSGTMDLGIRGKKAIVCASSKGLGKACAEFLAADGVDLVLLARGAEALEQTAAESRAKHKVNVTAIATDITTPAGREAALKACPNPD